MARFKTLLVCAVLTMAVALVGAPWVQVFADVEGNGPVITSQPESVSVNYPQGATFRVEVKDPENVASYRWQYSDGGNVFELDGSTASTDTLVLPATTQNDPEEGSVCCIITDKDGNETVSESASITINNRDEDLTVLFVGDLALLPGETMDLSATPFGSGVIRFDSNGADVYLENVNIDSSKVSYDSTLAPSSGMVLDRLNGTEEEYRFHLTGDCVIDNKYYDPDYNACGISFAVYPYNEDGDPAPLVLIDGDGSLTLKGGTNSIYTTADLELAADLKTTPYETVFNDAITCHNLYVDEGVHLDLKANGSGIVASGDTYFYNGSVVDIETNAPHVSVGPTTKCALFLEGAFEMTNSELTVKGHASPDQFLPYEEAYLESFGGIYLVAPYEFKAEGSKISIEFDAEHGDSDYAFGFFGIIGGEDNCNLVINGCDVSVKIDSDDIIGANGIYTFADMNVSEGSKIDVQVHTSGEVHGIAPESRFDVTDSDISVDVSSSSGDGSYGILCADSEISLSSDSNTIQSSAKDGIAFLSSTGKVESDIKEFTPNYKAKHIRLTGAKCSLPEKSVISLASIPLSEDNLRVETFYDEDDTSKPAEKIVISHGDVVDNKTNRGPVIFLAVAALLICAAIGMLKSKKDSTEQEKAEKDNE